MPAAKRYTKSEVEQFLEGLMKLPKGTPPEPTYTKDEILRQLAEPIRRRILEDHVAIADIVKELNAGGLKISERKVGQLIRTHKTASKGSRRSVVAPIKSSDQQAQTAVERAPSTRPASGLLKIDRDEDHNL